MRHAYTIRMTIAAATFLAVAQTAMPASTIKPSETSRRIWRAIENNDRSELPFFEEIAFSEDAGRTERVHTSQEDARIRLDRRDAARAYLKLATLDESLGFMRKLYSVTGGTNWWYYPYKLFLEKAAEEEKGAEDATRERLYTFLLEIVQTNEGAEDAHWADTFLLERVPGYAESKQRAALVRYANTGNDWVTNTFNPIKVHFDAIPPSKRVDLRNRFPGLPPPPEDPPEPSSPYLWSVLGIIAVLVALILALILRKAKKGKR